MVAPAVVWVSMWVMWVHFLSRQLIRWHPVGPANPAPIDQCNEDVAKIIPTNHRKRLRAGGVKVEAERPVVAADPAKDAPPASGA